MDQNHLNESDFLHDALPDLPTLQNEYQSYKLVEYFKSAFAKISQDFSMLPLALVSDTSVSVQDVTSKPHLKESVSQYSSDLLRSISSEDLPSHVLATFEKKLKEPKVTEVPDYRILEAMTSYSGYYLGICFIAWVISYLTSISSPQFNIGTIVATIPSAFVLLETRGTKKPLTTQVIGHINSKRRAKLANQSKAALLHFINEVDPEDIVLSIEQTVIFIETYLPMIFTQYQFDVAKELSRLRLLETKLNAKADSIGQCVDGHLQNLFSSDIETALGVVKRTIIDWENYAGQLEAQIKSSRRQASRLRDRIDNQKNLEEFQRELGNLIQESTQQVSESRSKFEIRNMELQRDMEEFAQEILQSAFEFGELVPSSLTDSELASKIYGLLPEIKKDNGE